MMSRPAPSPSSPSSSSTSIADIQLHIRRNAEEYRQVLDDLADWESQIKSTFPTAAASAASARTLPPVRGSLSSTKPASPTPATRAPKPKSKTPRDYSAWDKIDVDSLLQEMENQDYDQFHHQQPPSGPKPSSNVRERNPQLALIEKDTGNVYFRKSKFTKALTHYSNAIDLDPLNPVLYLNRAAAYLRLSPPKAADAESDCTRALDLDRGKNVKALFRRAMARKELDNKVGALEDLRKALVLEPTNKEVKKELEALEPPKPAAVPEMHEPLLPPVAPAVKAPKRRKLKIREFSSAPMEEETKVQVTVKGPGQGAEEVLMKEIKTTTSGKPDSAEAMRRLRSWQATADAIESTAVHDVLPLLVPPPPESRPEDVKPKPVLEPTSPSKNAAPVPSNVQLDNPPAQSSPTTTPTLPNHPPEIPRLPVPAAAYEFSMAISQLTRHGHLPPSILGYRPTSPALVPANVSDTARNYLLSIPPKHLMTLFATAGVETEAIGWIVIMLRSLPPATDPKSAALKYNYLHYLSQCARFSVARRLLANAYVEMVQEVVTEIRQVFAAEGKVEAVGKVDKAKALWQV